MNIKNIFNIIKEYVISYYNIFIHFIKNVFIKTNKINKQTSKDNDIHIVKSKVKKVRIKKIEN